jgi:ribosomal protein S18 acetylase RimI-like enzyme
LPVEPVLHVLCLLDMFLAHATPRDHASITALVNDAFRGTGTKESWNSEAGVIEGERLTEALLLDDLTAKPDGHLLVYREDREGLLLGTVWLEPKHNGTWYLGLLTVRPELQTRKLGTSLLASAEDFARERGGRRIRMAVVNVRHTLIAWYQRRGYTLTGEEEPFPYEDQRFGRPLRDDLRFVVLAKDIQL